MIPYHIPAVPASWWQAAGAFIISHIAVTNFVTWMVSCRPSLFLPKAPQSNTEFLMQLFIFCYDDVVFCWLTVTLGLYSSRTMDRDVSSTHYTCWGAAAETCSYSSVLKRMQDKCSERDSSLVNLVQPKKTMDWCTFLPWIWNFRSELCPLEALSFSSGLNTCSPFSPHGLPPVPKRIPVGKLVSWWFNYEKRFMHTCWYTVLSYVFFVCLYVVIWGAHRTWP